MTIDEFRRRLIALLQQASALPPDDVLHEHDTSGLPNSTRIGCRKRLRLYRRPPSLRGDDVEALMTMVMGTPPKLAQRAREL